MLECKIGCLGPQRDRLPWATRQMTNDGPGVALPITVKNLIRKALAKEGVLDQMSRNFQVFFIHKNVIQKTNKKELRICF